ncbi:hypothetical protein [Streptomyces sp. 8N616]|uniref:hypothetical protein n=1 Tax=Streptomyces sp. 8N616 TaxID=3457414 RepID=UPI003FD62B78
MHTVEKAAETAVEKIVRTCLYEGYLLWPYRRSALKNAKRWTFGGVFPQACAAELGEQSVMQTQVLFDTGHAEGSAADVDVSIRVRFLQVVDRGVVREGPDGPQPVDELTVDGERYLAWQEAVEREVLVPVTLPAGLRDPATSAIDFPAGTDREPLVDASGRHVGSLVRSRRPLTGTVEVGAVRVADGVHRLTVRIENTTPYPGPDTGAPNAREEAAAYAFVSTHTLLHSDAGRFVSLIDPPAHLCALAAACDNRGTWPVLVDDGEGRPPGARRDSTSGAHTVLSSPVTLYDFPAVAPESPGDLFDGTEIDQLLVLSVLSLTEEEQAEARACDPRAREILDRCAGLSPDELIGLHGTIREFRPSEDA